MLTRLFCDFSIVINLIKDVSIKSVEIKKRVELINTVFIFICYTLQVTLIEIPTPRSPEDIAAGVHRGWWRVSHWCAGCERGRPPSCYSTGDERVAVCQREERACACSSTQRAPFGRAGTIRDADRCVVK